VSAKLSPSRSSRLLIALSTRVTLTYPFARLCLVSAEPQPGSTLSIRYDAGAVLIEAKTLRAYLESSAGENVHSVRDLEAAAQLIAQAYATVLAVPVVMQTHYVLTAGAMDVEVTATPQANDAA
jgi:7-cyano-7-deazaguanine reductase